MKFYGCFIGLLVLQVASAVPVPEPGQNLVRDKRKIDNVTEKPKIETPPVAVVPGEVKILKENEIPVDEGDKQERVKKQIFVKVPCGKGCEENMSEVMFLKPEDAAPAGGMELKQFPVKGARTIEPIYSFGPVSVNGAGGAYSAGGSGYSSYSHQAGVKPYSYSSSASYAAPAGMQFHAMIPYTLHRQPLSHHSFSNIHSIAAKPEISYYFDNQEPVVVEAEEHGEGHAQQSNSPVSLYCHSMKSKDLIKTLTPEAKTNATEDDLSTHDHIERVNEIKEEISQLNIAAQRIVDQQEKLAQMQQEHLERSANPEMRSFPARGPSRIRRPLFRPGFRENEDTVKEEDPKTDHDEMMMRQMYPYPGYDSYYGYRSAWPYMPSYQTGLPVYKAQAAPANHQDDVEFFMRMLDMGKRMGVLSKNFQPSSALPPKPEKKEEEVRSEGLIDDLTYGEEQKGADKPADSPSTMNMMNVTPKTIFGKKDKRGLLPLVPRGA